MVERYVFVWDEEEGYPPDSMELVAASEYDALAAELERVRALSIWGTSVPVGPTYDRIRELEAELAECRSSRQREHDLRVTIAGELESFKIRYQDEVNARVDAENELDAVRSGFVAELRKAKAALATARIAALALRGDKQ